MKLSWLIAELLSWLLPPEERECVRGDLEESGSTSAQAIRELLGLIFRRQLRVWSDWREWLALAGLIVPLCILLSVISKRISGESAAYIWMYANNWHWAFLANGGFWHVLGESAGLVLLRYMTLACWSWTAGFVFGAASRCGLRNHRLLFGFMLLLGLSLLAPAYLGFLSRQYLRHAPQLPSAHPSHGSNPILDSAFYRTVLPWLVQAFLVLLPGLWGMRQSARISRLQPQLRAVVWLAAGATLIAMVIQTPGVGFLVIVHVGQQFWSGWQVYALRLLNPVIYWPIVYLLAKVVLARRKQFLPST